MELYNNSGTLFARKIYETDFVVEVPAILNEDGSLNESQTQTDLDIAYELGCESRDLYETYTL